MTTKAPDRLQMSPLISRTLKTVGIIIILAALLDIIILPIPYKWLDPQWQVNFATQVIDRGIVPLVGVALLLTGCWVDSLSGMAVGDRKAWQGLRFWTVVFSSLLGLFFLILFPLHLTNVSANNTRALEQVNQDATQAEAQLNNRLNAEVQQQRQQIEQLLANEAQLNQAIQSGQVPPEQAALLRQFKENPQSLDRYVNEQVGKLRTQLQTEIGTRKEQALQSAKTESIKSGLRVGISSLLLAAGYIIVGWTGLKSLGTGTSAL